MPSEKPRDTADDLPRSHDGALSSPPQFPAWATPQLARAKIREMAPHLVVGPDTPDDQVIAAYLGMLSGEY